MSLSLDKNIILDEINKCSSVSDLEKLRIQYLGKKGLISLEMKSLSSLTIEDKKLKGKELNIFKSFFELQLNNKKSNIENNILRQN